MLSMRYFLSLRPLKSCTYACGRKSEPMFAQPHTHVVGERLLRSLRQGDCWEETHINSPQAMRYACGQIQDQGCVTYKNQPIRCGLVTLGPRNVLSCLCRRAFACGGRLHVRGWSDAEEPSGYSRLSRICGSAFVAGPSGIKFFVYPVSALWVRDRRTWFSKADSVGIKTPLLRTAVGCLSTSRLRTRDTVWEHEGLAILEVLPMQSPACVSNSDSTNCLLYYICSILYALCSILYTVYSILYTVYSILYIPYSILYLGMGHLDLCSILFIYVKYYNVCGYFVKHFIPASTCWSVASPDSMVFVSVDWYDPMLIDGDPPPS